MKESLEQFIHGKTHYETIASMSSFGGSLFNSKISAYEYYSQQILSGISTLQGKIAVLEEHLRESNLILDEALKEDPA